MNEHKLEIVFQDQYLVAINKPAGLLVHRSDIDRRETRFALQILRDQIGQRVYPLHRLDKPTSGILLFALDPAIARAMGEQIMAGSVTKKYLAIVRGHTDNEGVIDHAMREQQDKIADVLAASDKAAQTAVTHYKTLAICEVPVAVGRYSSARYSLVELRPKTGRKHQLRRHMKHISHHIIGDTTHGDGRHNRMFREKYQCSRLLLAATHLGFQHPITAQGLNLFARPTTSFIVMLEQLALTEHLGSETCWERCLEP